MPWTTRAALAVVAAARLVAAEETASGSTWEELPWVAGSGPYDFFGEVEFCKAGTSYGYRLPGSAKACGDLAPLIRMQAGRSYQLKLANTAGSDTRTSIHTHGLHISGDGNADDITRTVAGGNCVLYNWTIAGDHMEGTHWYHSHVHEHTNEQVSGGAFGMLVITPGAAVAGDVPPSVTALIANERKLMFSRVGGKTVNRKASERVEVAKDEWTYFRILGVDPGGSTDSISFQRSPCEVRVMAHDGVFLFNVPRDRVQSEHDLGAASRLDLAVRCSGNGGIWYAGTNSGSKVVDIVAVNGGSSTPSPYASGTSQWQYPRPEYLADLSAGSRPTTLSIKMTAAQISGRTWDPNTALAFLPYDSIQQWELSGTRSHAFHLHVYHMQVINGCGGRYEAGEYYDTIDSAVSPCVVRFHAKDIGGRVVLHCHVLAHEDNGAMTWVGVEGGPPAGFSDVAEIQGCATGPVPAPTPAPPASGPSPTLAPETPRPKGRKPK